jgi:hypothetical protein
MILTKHRYHKIPKRHLSLFLEKPNFYFKFFVRLAFALLPGLNIGEKMNSKKMEFQNICILDKKMSKRKRNNFAKCKNNLKQFVN